MINKGVGKELFMKYRGIKSGVIAAFIATSICQFSFAEDLSYEGEMPNSSIEMTAGQISEVSTGKMEAYIRAIVYTIVGVLNIALSYYWIPV